MVLALKNADDLLQDVMKAVDTSGDGKIQYEGMFCGVGVMSCIEFAIVQSLHPELMDRTFQSFAPSSNTRRRNYYRSSNP